jgi:uncharacterized protein (DUF983 family)
MDTPSKPHQSQDFSLTVIRTFLGRCPTCGEGRLFASYLKPVACCAMCGEALGHIRAEDGPAWLTILLVGHIVAPFLLGVVPGLMWPDWAILAVSMAFTLVLALTILPRVKGFFIGMIWRSGCIGSEE